jgi:thiol-disulfide isomerase/thioredoxin
MLQGRLRLTLLAACLILPGAAPYVRAADQELTPSVDADARAVLDAWGAYCKSLDAFQVQVESKLSVEAAGQHHDQTALVRLSAARPNKLAFQITRGDDSGKTELSLACDGKQCAGVHRATGGTRPKALWATEPAQEDWAAVTRTSFVTTALASATLNSLPAAVLARDPAIVLFSKKMRVTLVGREKLGDVECHVLQGVAEATTRNAGNDFDIRVWIEVGARPLVRQTRVTSGQIASKFVKVTALSTFADWNLNTPADVAFAFTPPEGCAQVGTLDELLTGRPSGKRLVDATPHPLVGKPAPAVELPLLDGGAINSTSWKNEPIVILDFWSTSCVSCIQGLPIVESVAKAYTEKNVQLFAVNVGQTADEVREFLQNVKWNGQAPIALDSDSVVAKAYGLSTMPHLVLIGRDGTVQAVRVAKAKDLEAELRADIEALLAGRNLAAERLAKAGKGTAAPAVVK